MMNKPVIAGIAAGILLAGIILGPIPGFFSAQAQEEQSTTGTTKKVTLIANEVGFDVDVLVEDEYGQYLARLTQSM